MVAAPRQQFAEHLSDGIEWGVLEKRTGRGRHPGVRRIRNLFMKALHQARFADACLADDQCHLPFTLERALPTIHQRA